MKKVIARIILVWFFGLLLMLTLFDHSQPINEYGVLALLCYPLLEAVWWALRVVFKPES